MTARAFITGLSGTTPTADERAFLREARPWGLILFARNIDAPAQVAALTASFREIVGADAPVLVDQEGGRGLGMAVPRPTAMTGFRWSRPTGRCSRRPISRLSGRSPACRWA